MGEVDSFIHDLRNKLALLYCMLKCSEMGYPPSGDKVEAVTERIEEILQSLSQERNLEPSNWRVPIFYTQQDFGDLIEFSIQKLSRLFPGLIIMFSKDEDIWDKNILVVSNKELLYQVLENAVENSRNARASEIRVTIKKVENKIYLTLCDNGEGFTESSKTTVKSKTVSGLNIILNNMKSMEAQSSFSQNPEGGVILSLIFKSTIRAV